MNRRGTTQTILANVPDNQGPTPGECLCTIVAVHNEDPLVGYPPDVNLSQAFTYKVNVQTPNGKVLYDKVIPAGRRWEYPWLVRSLPGQSLATGVPFYYTGTMMNRRFYLHAVEDRYAAPCTPPNTGSIFNG